MFLHKKGEVFVKVKGLLAMLFTIALCLTGCVDATLPNDSMSSTDTTTTTTTTVFDDELEVPKTELTSAPTLDTVTSEKVSSKKTTEKTTQSTQSRTKKTTTSTTAETFRTGFQSTTATPEENQFVEMTSQSALSTEEITLFYLDEKRFDKLVSDKEAKSFLYTTKRTYPQDGETFPRGIVAPFYVNKRLVNFVGNPVKIEEYLLKNNVDTEVTYSALIYTQFVLVTLYIQTTDGNYFITVDDIPGKEYGTSAYTYRYALHTPKEYAKFVKDSREEHMKLK